MACAEAVIADKEPFPLFKLPPEIWLRIGEYALSLAPEVSNKHSTVVNKVSKVWQERMRQPAITRTCHSLRAELLRVFYQHHVSCIFAWENHSNRMGKAAWLHAIGAVNRRSLGNVRLVTSSDMVDEMLFRLTRQLPSFNVGDDPRKHDERERRVRYALEPVGMSKMVFWLNFT
ncbi:hypothetical protein LTR97_011496 [Elasticomyces elasticus]|uniref:F-box domain-containing protein n=1 Tax=Elasticomyces elasticus TaxID=574655 RepID=A0AAN7ZYL1_9PEZI|nr:hypothetical protein LTR97_011496 [Elasticomyces elasticus]